MCLDKAVLAQGGVGGTRAMSNGYWTHIHPRNTDIWSWSQMSVHCFALLHCNANEINTKCFLDRTAQDCYRMFHGPSG